MENPSRAEATPPSHITSRKTRIWAVSSVAATLIGAAALAIPAIVSVNDRPSSAGTVETSGATPSSPLLTPSSQPSSTSFEAATRAQVAPWGELPASAPGRYSVWRIPVDAPVETFPPRHLQGEACSDEQFAWLAENALATDFYVDGYTFAEYSTFDMTVRNAATTGGSVSLQNIRLEGETVSAVPWVPLACQEPGGGRGPGDVKVMLNASGSVAVWDTADQMSEEVDGAPVVLNLAPGEVAEVAIYRSDPDEVERVGNLVADVFGTGETITLIEGLRLEREPIEGYGFGFFHMNSEGKWTFGSGDGEISSGQQAADHLKQAAESVGWEQ